MDKIKLPQNPGDTGWKEILHKRKVNPKLSENTNVDYLIIGGGFAGLSAARRLNQINTEAKIAVSKPVKSQKVPQGETRAL